MATLEDVMELAGYFAAHAIWCVSDAETLVPMLTVRTADGSEAVTRFEADEYDDAVHDARAVLEANPDGHAQAAVLFDGYITLPTGKTDAVMIELVDYGSGQRLMLALPYRHASAPGGFAVFRPKFLTAPDRKDVKRLGEALFRGLEGHEQGAAVWSKYLDESQ